VSQRRTLAQLRSADDLLPDDVYAEAVRVETWELRECATGMVAAIPVRPTATSSSYRIATWPASLSNERTRFAVYIYPPPVRPYSTAASRSALPLRCPLVMQGGCRAVCDT
jgi:hypothetical protein